MLTMGDSVEVTSTLGAENADVPMIDDDRGDVGREMPLLPVA